MSSASANAAMQRERTARSSGATVGSRRRYRDGNGDNDDAAALRERAQRLQAEVERLRAEVTDANANASAPAALAVSAVSREKIAEFVAGMLADKEQNVWAIPDAIEGPMREAAIHAVVAAVTHIFTTTRMQIFGHDVRLVMSPSSQATQVAVPPPPTRMAVRARSTTTIASAPVDDATSWWTTTYPSASGLGASHVHGGRAHDNSRRRRLRHYRRR